MNHEEILRVLPLEFPWQTTDPFLFCAHHNDHYPAGNETLGPAASLEGRAIGQDFEGRDGWRMYHGESVPGFPSHPHRGFETVTLVRTGLIDHADSLGAAARFGRGDVQWITAGRGIVHSEMFPLLERERPNPLELFQIWLNLPAPDKMAEPHFAVFWDGDVPRHVERDAAGRATEVTVVAGAIGDARPPAPPPRSWAARADTDVAIWLVSMEPGAHWTLPAPHPSVVASDPEAHTPAAHVTHRILYFFRGNALHAAGHAIAPYHGIEVRPGAEVPLEAGDDGAELLLLQGRPIDEPVVQYGPFVGNSHAEIEQAFIDYQRTHFGGWPWPRIDPVFPRSEGRFAKYVNGRIERAR